MIKEHLKEISDVLYATQLLIPPTHVASSLALDVALFAILNIDLYNIDSLPPTVYSPTLIVYTRE
jgi:hypothetical protein